ncbi:hypothetical protein L7F22_007506 [Adiantum nelumboides]|nr:hypothetical protein [Adiantum nelumboides]
MRGQGGVALIYKEELQEAIEVCKVDEHKRYIWAKVHTNDVPIYIAGCYIPHGESPLYNVDGLDKKDPFNDLCMDISMYAKTGVVVVIGDLNSRIAHAQAEIVDHSMQPFEKQGQITLDPVWDRCSSDLNVNAQGSAMLSMMQSMHMVVLNGTKKFPLPGGYTCYTANKGTSTIDYALIGYEALGMVEEFAVGDRSPNSDHTPIHVNLQIPLNMTTPKKHLEGWSYKMHFQKKQHYADTMELLLMHQEIPNDIQETWGVFRNAICEATNHVMGQIQKKRRKTRGQKRRKTRGLPQNSWLDDECKAARQQLKSFHALSEEWVHASRMYTSLTQSKKRAYELNKEQQDLIKFKQNPRKEWKSINGKR